MAASVTRTRQRYGAELALDLLLAEALGKGYRVDEEAEQYRRLIVAGLERLGVKRYREATELAYATAWLIDGECRVDDGRGADLRALAAAAVYWAWLVEHSRGLLGRPVAQRAWELVGSSRASFYRAIRIWSECLLGLGSHHALLRGEARSLVFSGVAASYPGYFIAALRGYTPVAAGFHRLRLGRLRPVELLLLPHGDNTRRTGAVNGRMTVTFDLERLYSLLRMSFDYQPFSAQDFARILALHYPSAVQVLKKLETLGIVERIGEGVWRLREKPIQEPMYPAHGGRL
ncbi:hypothetical protein [Pyrodictium abyssi]|uniref:Transcriptional regulator n=1 Tax=Pyrodictium abyssi TaxID=54256 RepID=A0ABM8J045_9CREN|nr:hypothetical protein PABY_21290 [Pyrodictium abyssi]